MNLNEKAKLKEKVEALEALVSCIDLNSWNTDTTNAFINENRNQMCFVNLSALNTLTGSASQSIAILIKMLKLAIAQAKAEIGD